MHAPEAVVHEARLVAPAPSAQQAGDGVDPAVAAARQRLEDQIGWYDGKSRHNQRWFKRLKIAQIVTAAAIPVAAAAGATSWLLGGGGAAMAGPYAGAARPAALLAERVEGLVSQEHAAWVSQQREAAQRAGAT